MKALAHQATLRRSGDVRSGAGQLSRAGRTARILDPVSKRQSFLGPLLLLNPFGRIIAPGLAGHKHILCCESARASLGKQFCKDTESAQKSQPFGESRKGAFPFMRRIFSITMISGLPRIRRL
jgi:hypothetical protein